MEKSKAEKSPWVKKTKKTRLSGIKTCCNAMLLPGNLALLSQTLGGSVVPLVCGFIRCDNRDFNIVHDGRLGRLDECHVTQNPRDI